MNVGLGDRLDGRGLHGSATAFPDAGDRGQRLVNFGRNNLLAGSPLEYPPDRGPQVVDVGSGVPLPHQLLLECLERPGTKVGRIRSTVGPLEDLDNGLDPVH